MKFNSSFFISEVTVWTYDVCIIIETFHFFFSSGNEFDINVGLKKKRRKRENNFIDDKWREVGFYLRTLPKIIKKVQSRDPAFLRSLEDEV